MVANPIRCLHLQVSLTERTTTSSGRKNPLQRVARVRLSALDTTRPSWGCGNTPTRFHPELGGSESGYAQLLRALRTCSVVARGRSHFLLEDGPNALDNGVSGSGQRVVADHIGPGGRRSHITLVLKVRTFGIDDHVVEGLHRLVDCALR